MRAVPWMTNGRRCDAQRGSGKKCKCALLNHGLSPEFRSKQRRDAMLLEAVRRALSSRFSTAADDELLVRLFVQALLLRAPARR